MFIARWQIDARFGHKHAALDLMKEWDREIGAKIGLDPSKAWALTGSIGTLESRIENNIQCANLAELDEIFAKLSKMPAHGEWGRKLEPYVVSGTSRWDILRVVEG